jgi:hypothetical protein
MLLCLIYLRKVAFFRIQGVEDSSESLNPRILFATKGTRSLIFVKYLRNINTMLAHFISRLSCGNTYG